MASCLKNIRTKNYWNLIILLQVTIENDTVHVYTVCFKNNSQHCFSHNFVKVWPTLIIFGQDDTVWNRDAPNCYITLWYVLYIKLLNFAGFALSIQQRAPRELVICGIKYYMVKIADNKIGLDEW